MADHFVTPEVPKGAVVEKKAEEKKPPTFCASCGWLFEVENKKWRCFDEKDPKRKRLEQRTEIRIRARDGSIVIRCDHCYEKDLWHAGKHSGQMGPESEAYRAAIFGKATHKEATK